MIMPTHGTRADHDPGAGPKEGAMTGNLEALGQAAGPIWLDDLSPEPPVSGSLAALAADDHVVGVTTNPSIFARAIADSDTHDAQIRDLPTRGADAGESMRALTTFDVRWACDVLRPVYHATATGILLPARPYASGTA